LAPIGTAPDRETTTSAEGRALGGNIEVRDIAPGIKSSARSIHDGALFIGEMCTPSQGTIPRFTGTAAETQATLGLDSKSQRRGPPGCALETRIDR